MGEVLLPVVLAMQLVGIAGIMVGWLLAWDAAALQSRGEVDDEIGEEETAEEVTQPALAPVLAQWFREPFADWSLANSAPHRHVTAMGKSESGDSRVGVPPSVPQSERVVALRPMSALERLEGPTRRIIRDEEGYRVEPWWFGGRHRTPETRLRTAPYVVAPNGLHPTTEYPLLDGVS